MMEPLSFSQIGIAFAVLAQFVIVGAVIWNVANSRRAQKRDVTIVTDSVSQDDFRRHVEANINSRRNMHKEVESLKERVASVETSIEHLVKQSETLDGKLDDMNKTMCSLPSKLIADLRNAGALK